MRIERITLTNFRCFGPEPVTIDLNAKVTAFIGANGSGKTAVFQALSRLFGVTNDQRRVRRQDFHVPQDESSSPGERTFSIEVLLSFPELRDQEEDADTSAVPEFFQQMAVDDRGNLKCRLKFDARWIDDGSTEGAIETQFRAVRTFATEFEDADCSNVTTADRTRIQLVYVPSVRDGESQVEGFLRGRLWRAISWADEFREAVKQGGDELNEAFSVQPGVDTVVRAVRHRWSHLTGPDVQGTPDFRPLDQRFDQFVRRVVVQFEPGETGRAVELSELSDGQRSLFHIGMTLAALDVEDRVRQGDAGGFNAQISLPALTLIALEEPENNLSPFFLSRILGQIQEVATESSHAQAFVSSHSAGLVGRVPPDDIRHFRLTRPSRTSRVQGIALPPAPEDAGKFVREAVRRYPELYFARFVILGEGASEEIVIPRVAEANGIHIDKSFVAVVPLGGRHVNHFWRLLKGLGIPHATLLDLDAGRAGGGWGRIKTACTHLIANGADPDELFGQDNEHGDVDGALASFDGRTLDTTIGEWTKH